MKIRRPEMFRLAEQGVNNNLWKQILNFIIVFFLISIIGGIPAAIVLKNSISEITLENMEEIEKIASFSSRSYLLATLFGTLLSSIVLVWYCKSEEKRSFRSIGFQRKNAFRDYVIGVIIGFILFSSVVGINVLTGAMTIEGIVNNFNWTTLGFILLFFFGFFFQGAFEEILTRGYLMVGIGARYKTITALIVSSVAFAILHGANPGVTVLSLINLVLIALFFGLYIICFDNIWGACAIHSVWNFVQGNFYGIKVSGLEIQDSVLTTTMIPGKELINGGLFGAEGGIATTIVIVLAIILLLIYMKKTGSMENNS